MDSHYELDEPKLRRADMRVGNGAADRIIRWLVTLAVSSFVVTAAVVAGLVFFVGGDGAPWEPLGPFPQQSVVAVTDDMITVVGTKCYTESVTIRGEAGWQSVDPIGIQVATGSGVQTRDLDELDDNGEPVYAEGCRTDTFENPIPPEVLAHPEVLIWKVAGFEEPVRDGDGDLREGLRQTWETEPFSLTLSE
jgi:hypothetical protein